MAYGTRVRCALRALIVVPQNRINCAVEEKRISIFYERSTPDTCTKRREASTMPSSAKDVSSSSSTIILSDYERMRAKNIERNNARLRALGLISVKEETTSNSIAWRKRQTTVSQLLRKASSPTGGKKRKREAPNMSSPSRKSLRLQGKQPDGAELVVEDESATVTKDDIQKERDARIQECREVRLQRANEAYLTVEGAAQAAKENPTASYDHCLMRVRTMTEKGLANRVKVIERAAGKHSVIKMAIFKSCLQDQALWDLAELSSSALERLKALKPPVEDE
jgi:hypothetical protein